MYYETITYTLTVNGRMSNVVTESRPMTDEEVIEFRNQWQRRGAVDDGEGLLLKQAEKMVARALRAR